MNHDIASHSFPLVGGRSSWNPTCGSWWLGCFGRLGPVGSEGPIKTSVFSGKNMCSIRVSEALGMIMTMGMKEKLFLMVIIVIIIFIDAMPHPDWYTVPWCQVKVRSSLVGLNPWPCRILPRLILQRTSKEPPSIGSWRENLEWCPLQQHHTWPKENTADEIHHLSVEKNHRSSIVSCYVRRIHYNSVEGTAIQYKTIQ